jgi:hypothetical protein
MVSVASFVMLRTPVEDYWLITLADFLFAGSAATLFRPGAADWFQPNQISPTTFE